MEERSIRSVKRNCVSTNGIAYVDTGTGPAVLLIHAFGLDADMWEPQVEPLVSAGYRALVPDLRGFGSSPPPPSDYTFATTVSDMLDVLDAAGVERAVAAGVSMGSATVIALAIESPSRVAGLLLADNSRPDGPRRGRDAADRIRRLGLDGLADVYEPVLFGEAFRVGQPGLIDRWRRKLVARNEDDLATIVEPYHGRPDPGPFLGAVSVPAVVVFGEEDAAIPEARRSDYLAIPGVTEHRIADAGHVSNLERPDEFNRILLDLVARACGTGSG